MTNPVALVQATVLGLLLVGCGARQVEDCPPVGAHTGNLVEVGGDAREIHVERASEGSVVTHTIEWEGRTVVALAPRPAPASTSALVSLREEDGRLIRRVIVTAKQVSGAPGQRTRDLLRQVARFYELPETNVPAPGQEALHARVRHHAKVSVTNLLDLVTQAQTGAAAGLDARTLGMLDRMVAGVEQGVVAIDRCVADARTEQALVPSQTWSALSKAVETTVVVGTLLANSADAGLDSGLLAWSPAASLVSLDLLTTGVFEGRGELSLSSSSLAESARLIRDAATGGALTGDAIRAGLLCGYYFGEAGPRWEDPNDACGGCGAGESCVADRCEPLASVLSCENRCCKEGENCPVSAASCACDVLCVDLGDCCADYVAACVD